MLQWGRGLKTPEIRRRHPSRRRRNCFNGAGVLRPRKSARAAAARALDARLQWGRGLKTPEIGRYGLPCTWRGKLQWGRGLKTPEMPTFLQMLVAVGSLQWGRGLKTPEIN